MPPGDPLISKDSYTENDHGEPIGYDIRSSGFNLGIEADEQYGEHMPLRDGDRWRVIDILKNRQIDRIREIMERRLRHEYRARIYCEETPDGIRFVSETLVQKVK